MTLAAADLLSTDEEETLVQTLPRLDFDTSQRELELGEAIGMGGMGVVRDGVQIAMGRHVAVKALRPDLRNDPGLAMLLLREAWITGALEHPNIIPIYSVGVDAQGGPLIVMKRIEGTPWSKYVKDPLRDLRWHLKIFLQVCNAIDFAGSRGFIHRDLKPDNVMIGSFREVYVLDWGVAVSIEDDHGGRVPLAKDVTGISGTPSYMAPEMAAETGAQLTIRTDVYLLGAILHELITKQKKHLGPNMAMMVYSAMHSEPYAYGPDAPAELAAIANRATHCDPAKRFATAGDLRAAIERYLEHESSLELSEQAERRMNMWSQLLSLETRPDPVAIQSLFDEARFAFQQALRAWPANARARRGLENCLVRKFEHELAREDFEAASVVLGELEAERPDLEARLEVLRARMVREAAELSRLRQLGVARDLNIGRRTRSTLMIVFALVHGMTAPLYRVFESLGVEAYAFFFVATTVKMVLAVVLCLVLYKILTKTEVNRHLTMMTFMLLIVELIVRKETMQLGRPIENSLLVDFGVYAVATASVAITVDRRLACIPVFYLAGAFLADHNVHAVPWFLGACHLGCGWVTAGIWRPKRAC